MKKLMLCIGVCFMMMPHGKVNAGNGIENTVISLTVEQRAEGIYNSIDFGGNAKPSLDVFSKAYYGYSNLKDAGKLNADKDIITICDMSLSANANRMWIIDLHERKVLLNTYVAHGQGSGDEFANKFSNKMNSHQSSLGFYVTGNTYNGEHGNSLYLYGMDKGYNDLAYERNIVVHGADYVNTGYINNNQRLGRSWGCPAVSSKLSDKVIGMMKDSTCLFIYYPQARYLQSSVWLNRPITEQNEFDKLAMAGRKAKPEIIYEYGPYAKSLMKDLPQLRLPLF